MSEDSFQHRREYRIRLEPGSDERAPGGAVTVGLCGHWDHDGPCRWPHFSSITADDDGSHRLVVEFDAPEHETEMVNAKIDASLMRGRLTGPDGVISQWVIER